jgi:hypothetical protein
MKETILEILPDRRMTSAEVAAAIKGSVRKAQHLAQDKIIKAVRQTMPGGGVQWMFEPESVQEYLKNPGQLKPKAAAPSAAVAVRTQKTARSEAALAVPKILTDLLDRQAQAQDAYLKQLEVQASLAAKQLELQATTAAETLKNVVAQIFAERQAERDADRYRFDAERADRAARLARKTRDAVPVGGKVNGKAKAARA